MKKFLFEKNGGKKEFSLLLAIFVFFMIFFISAHPIVVFDTDDWLYLAKSRYAIPTWGSWNPTRIFPEILMPIASMFGVYIIKPIFQIDFTDAISVSYAITVSIFITMYFASFILFCKKKIGMNTKNTVYASLLFFTFHFLIFRSSTENNKYLFHALDACCYFYYLIPALLNISVVLYLFSFKDELSTGKKSFMNPVLLLATYLALFSNQFQSIILGVYAGVILLVEGYKYIKNRKKISIKKFLKMNSYYVLVCVILFAVQIFELNGGRAASLSNSDDSFADNFIDTLLNIFYLAQKFNLIFLALLVVSLLYGIFLILKNRKKFYEYVFFVMELLFVGIYLILACTIVNPSYIMRTDVVLGVLSVLVGFMAIMINGIMSEHSQLNGLKLILLLVLYSFIYTPGTTFLESNIENLSPEVCKNINNMIIDEVVKADNNEETETVVTVPKFDSSDNWPIANYGGNAYSTALYEFNLTKRYINIEFDYSDELTEKYIK